MDTLQFHWDKFRWKNKVDSKWWNPEISWKNKYIQHDPRVGLAFEGIWGWMSNFLDAWHFFKMIMIFCFTFSIIFFPYSFKLCVFENNIFNWLSWLLIFGIAWNIPFNFAFNHLFKSKNKKII